MGKAHEKALEDSWHCIYRVYTFLDETRNTLLYQSKTTYEFSFIVRLHTVFGSVRDAVYLGRYRYLVAGLDNYLPTVVRLVVRKKKHRYIYPFENNQSYQPNKKRRWTCIACVSCLRYT